MLFHTVCTCIIILTTLLFQSCAHQAQLCRRAETFFQIIKKRKNLTQMRPFFQSNLLYKLSINEAPDLVFQTPAGAVTARLWIHLCLCSSACIMTTVHLANCERRDGANFAVIDSSHPFLSEQDMDTTGGITQRGRLLLAGNLPRSLG